MANSKDNLSAVLHEIDYLRLEQVPLPKKPANNEVLLRAKCVRICGSDAHYWETLILIGNFILEDPIILGHETCAEVVAVGPDVKHLKVGDLQRVGISPNSSYIRPIMSSKLLINCLKKREL
jgi:threonine dehydrogenase-like Zn-dependent dehydrogenase